MPPKWEQYLAVEADPAWKDVDKVLCNWRNRTPRFLFRGFHPKSGGGHQGLNNQHRICPHAFLGRDTIPPISSHSFADLSRLIDGHLDGFHVQSPFSSWSGDFQTALTYAASRGTDGAHIVILDAEPYSSEHRVHHVTALKRADLAEFDYPCEYLIYGPISGSDYHCISLDSLNQVDRLYSEDGFAQQWYRCDDEARFAKLGVRNFKEEVLRAQHIARYHMPTLEKTTRRMWSAFPIVFTVAELSRRRAPTEEAPEETSFVSKYSYRGDESPLRDSSGDTYEWKVDEIRVVMDVLAHDVDLLYMAGDDGISMEKPTHLVNSWTYVEGFPQLRLMVDMLERLLNVAEWKCKWKLLYEVSTPSPVTADSPRSSSSCLSGDEQKGEKRKADAALRTDGSRETHHGSAKGASCGSRPAKKSKRSDTSHNGHGHASRTRSSTWNRQDVRGA